MRALTCCCKAAIWACKAQSEEGSGQRWQIAGNGGRQLRWKGSQAALMQAGQQFEMLTAHSFFAAIAGMALKEQLSIRQPAV